MSSQAARRWVLTASFAAITATGAWYGAGLKTQQELKEEKAAAMEATPEEKILQLESRKTQLLHHRAELERKIERLSSRTNKDAPPTSG